MASISLPKDAAASPPASSSLSSAVPGLSPLSDLYHRFSSWKKSLDLPAPGTVESLTKEVKSASAPCSERRMSLTEALQTRT